MIMNHKKLYRLYSEEGLSVRRRRGRKRARGSRTPMPVPLRPGDRWSMDFVSDTFGASRKFRILAINDDCCRVRCSNELASPQWFKTCSASYTGSAISSDTGLRTSVLLEKLIIVADR